MAAVFVLHLISLVFRHDDEPPSSRTPVVFETDVGSSASSSAFGGRVAAASSHSQRASKSQAHAHRLSVRRLGPIVAIPLAFAALGALASLTLHHGGAPAAASLAALPPRPVATFAATPLEADDDDLDLLEPCPKGMALVARGGTRVCVDRWEASLVEIRANGQEVPHPANMTPNIAGGMKIKAVSLPGVAPQAYVSKAQAAIACTNAKKRLCSADEWKTACEGPGKTTYPYGAKSDRRACNTHGKNPMKMLMGTNTKGMWGDVMHHPLLNTFPGTVAKTGEFDRCTNDYGVYDMVGNVHEWTADGAFRGGYYRDDKTNAPGCRYHTTAHAPTYSDYSTGFRCCADAR